MWGLHKVNMVAKNAALKGRSIPIDPGNMHEVFQRAFTDYHVMDTPIYEQERLVVGMGCFWGAERLFWKQPGVIFTSVGYAGGYTPNPTYEEVCSGLTGHSEVVQIDFNPSETTLLSLLKVFWEQHDPTQGMRQGNDIGTQYRSVIYYTTPDQKEVIEKSKRGYQKLLDQGEAPQAMSLSISTEIEVLKQYYYAEPYHQQYLHKNPQGYCGLKGTGAVCPW